MKLTKVLVVGAGEAGKLVKKQLIMSNQVFVGFVDDRGMNEELEILGVIDELSTLAAVHEIDEIIVAIPSLKSDRKLAVIEKALSTKCKIKVIPSLVSIQNDITKINLLRDIQLTDLLNRDEVWVEKSDLLNLKGKTILISGAGGSIGSEICRQLIEVEPEKLILLGHGENSIYQTYEELKKITSIPCIQVIGDIRDQERMEIIFKQYRPEIVYHAAAHKHVPLMQNNVVEAVGNNVFGTRTMALLADKYQVEKFVMISTDKAINPENIMGATKKLAEMLIQFISKKSKTIFSIVRFGNVLGSKGSVVPLFQKQIELREPITLTNPKMTRYFMSIPEASRLVLLSSAMTNHGNIFVLNMGEPIKILTLAKKLIQLNGLNENDIPIKIMGIRPGEKIHEALFNDYETLEESGDCRLYKVNSNLVVEETFYDFIQSLQIIKDDQYMEEIIFQFIKNERGIILQSLEVGK